MAQDKKEKNTEQLLETIIYGIQEVKGEKITILDLKNLPHAIADYFVICEANSTTQVEAIADSVEKETRKKLNDGPGHVDGKSNGVWVILDYVNIVVHVFQREQREKYNLEDLWGDAQIQEVLDHRA